jgi:hypothetical protein
MMGFGLMGAGAAVGGLMEGYQKGKKFAQDEERFEMEKERFGLEKVDAEDRKMLRGLQMRQGEQALKKGEQALKKGEQDIAVGEINLRDAEQDREIESQIRNVWKGAEAEIVSQQNPRPPGAIAAPGAADATDGAAQVQPPRSVFQIRQDAFTKALELQAGRRGANIPEILKQAMGASRLFRQAETQETISLLESYGSGRATQDQVFAELAKQNRPALPGTELRIVDKPLFPGSQQTFRDVEVVLPDGRGSVSLDSLSQSTLDPDKLFDNRTKLGQLMASVSHHAAMQSLAEEANRDKRLNYAETMRKLDAQIAQQNRLFGLREEEFKDGQWERTKASAERSFARTFNYAPLDDVKLDKLRREDEDRPINVDAKGKPDPNKKTRVEQYQERIAAAEGDLTMAMLTFARNRDFRTGRPNATEAEVLQALRKAQQDREKPADKRTAVQYDDLGHAFVNVNNNKVLLPFSKPGTQTGADPKTRSEQSRDAGGPVSRAPGIDYERMPLAQLASSAAYSAEARRVYERRMAEQRALPGAPGFWKGVTPPPPAAVPGGLDTGR